VVPAHRVHPRRCAVGVGEFPFGMAVLTISLMASTRCAKSTVGSR
jgi:hypothetical protein